MKSKATEVLIETPSERIEGREVPYSEFNLLQRLIDIQAELDSRNALFKEYDFIVCELERHGFKRAEIGNEVILLKDNFASGNTAFKACGVNRFDVEVISRELDAKRKAKLSKGDV